MLSGASLPGQAPERRKPRPLGRIIATGMCIGLLAAVAASCAGPSRAQLVPPPGHFTADTVPEPFQPAVAALERDDAIAAHQVCGEARASIRAETMATLQLASVDDPASAARVRDVFAQWVTAEPAALRIRGKGFAWAPVVNAACGEAAWRAGNANEGVALLSDALAVAPALGEGRRDALLLRQAWALFDAGRAQDAVDALDAMSPEARDERWRATRELFTETAR